jgi:hypothetical protein
VASLVPAPSPARAGRAAVSRLGRSSQGTRWQLIVAHPATLLLLCVVVVVVVVFVVVVVVVLLLLLLLLLLLCLLLLLSR